MWKDEWSLRQQLDSMGSPEAQNLRILNPKQQQCSYLGLYALAHAFIYIDIKMVLKYLHHILKVTTTNIMRLFKVNIAKFLKNINFVQLRVKPLWSRPPQFLVLKPISVQSRRDPFS
jgi:hypothetical protein